MYKSHSAAVNPDYRSDIDGLRAIAVLLVVVFHFNLIPGGNSGFMGVDIFFVISGYLITKIIVTQLEAGVFSFTTFYLRRIRRLAPALFVVLCGVIFAGWLLLFPAELIDLAKQTLAAQLYVSNIFFWRSINYFGLQAEDVYLLHTWSLSLEEQFYLFFPPLFYLLNRYRPTWFWPSLLIIFFLSFALNVWFVSSKPEATFYLLPSRAWELLAGSLTYWVATHYVGSRFSDEWLSLIGLGLIAAAVIAFAEEMYFPGWFALLPVLGAGLVLLGGGRSPTFVSKLLRAAPLVYVGRISYALYLVHWPVNVFSKQILATEYTAPLRGLMLLVSFFLAICIFHFVEDPIRRGRFSIFRGANLTRGYFVGLALTLCAVLSVQLMQGFPSRFPAEAMRIAHFVKDTSYVPACEFDSSPLSENEHFCRIGAKNVEPDWLVYGDSHAAAAFNAFDQWLDSKGRAGLFKFKSACLPIVDVHRVKDKGLCYKFNESIGNFLEKSDSINNVFLVSSWHQPLDSGAVSQDGLTILSRDDSIRVFEIKFSETVQSIYRQGKKVFVWEPVPGARGNVPLEMAKSKISGVAPNLEFTREEYFNEFGFFFRSLSDQKKFIEHSFSPSSVLCETGKCRVAIDGSPLYHDNAHVTASSAPLWFSLLQKQFER